MQEINNLQLNEEPGASPEIHLAELERLRKIAERYEAYKELAFLSVDDPSAADAIYEMVPEEGLSEDDFDNFADIVALELKKLKG